MGHHTTLVLPIIVVTALLLPPSVWLTWKTIQNVLRVATPPAWLVSEKRVSSGSLTVPSAAAIGTPSPMTDSQTQNYHIQRRPNQKKSSHWNIYCSAVCSICYTISVCLMLIRESLIYHRLSDGAGNEKRVKRVISNSGSLSILFGVYNLFAYPANVFLVVVCFQRLNLTFQRSQYQLHPRTVKMVNWMIIVGATLGIISVPFAVLRLYTIGFLILAPAWLAFPFFFVWLLYRFMNTTRTIAHKMVQIHQGGSSRSIDEAVLQRSRELLNASLRLTVSTSLATLASMIVMSFWLLRAAGWNNRFPILLHPIDSFCNIYAMVCTFSHTQNYYHSVLGCLHQWLLTKLLESH